MTFNLQEHDSEKQHTKHKHCALSKSSRAASHSSPKRSQSKPSETSDCCAKAPSLLKPGAQPAPYSYLIKSTPIDKKHSSNRQENSPDSVCLSVSVRRVNTNTSLLKSTSHTVSHTLLTRDERKELIISNNNQSTFSNKATLQYTYSAAHNYSVQNRGKKSNSSANPPVKTSSPDKLSAETTTQISRTPVPTKPTNHPSNLLPNDPSKNLTVLTSLSTPLTHRGTVSHTPNASEMPKQLNVPQNPGVTAIPSRPTHLRMERPPHSFSAGEKKTRSSVRRPQGSLDPVSSFMMLRGVLRLPVENRPEVTPLHTTGKKTG